MKSMTKQELESWMKDNKCVDSDSDFDERGNEWGYKVFEVEGALYRVDFCNNYPCKEWCPKKKHYVDSYSPFLVEKKTRTVVITEYVPVT